MLFNFLGAYDNGVTYSANDAVVYAGSCYVMTTYIGAAGYDPVSYPGSWTMVASKGSDGAPGANGPTGDPGAPCNMRGAWLSATNYYAGDVVVHLGTLYAVVNNHYSMIGTEEPGIDTTNYIAVPALTGPQGPAGADGAAGAQGPQGPAGSPAKTVNDVSATVPYTLQLSDNNNIVFTSNTNASTGIIVPADSTLDFPIGATIIIVSSDTYNGIAPETVGWYPTINGGVYGSQVGKTVVTLVKTAANTWYWA
jgi:hypothetical protein